MVKVTEGKVGVEVGWGTERTKGLGVGRRIFWRLTDLSPSPKRGINMSARMVS